MNRYKIIESTGGHFSGLTFECESNAFIQEKIEEILKRRLDFIEVKEINGVFTVRNEHITLIIQEVNS